MVAELDYCAARGIAHSAFKAWDELDRAKALAWQAWNAERCRSCGVHPSATEPERGGHPDALHLSDVLCRTCEIADAVEKSDPVENRVPGVHKVWRRAED